MRSLDWHHIVECYEISPESLTKDFILNNETAVKAIIRKDYRDDKLAVATRAERHRICLKLLRIYSPESISHLQNLVPKMARVFDNTDASRRAKKSGLKTDKTKLALLNSALYANLFRLGVLSL
ncbi:hypothetical protein RclHR1_02340005 [Rhizophagus clarus]|nr:hypothetical protein RclHR1_02340005 [Rhizophagus clarus]